MVTKSAEAGPVHDALVPRHRLQQQVDALLGNVRQFGQSVENFGGDGPAVFCLVEGADGLDLQPDVGAALVVRGLLSKESDILERLIHERITCDEDAHANASL